MKGKFIIVSILSAFFALSACSVGAQNKKLKLVFIRHGERPDGGDNLNCQGFNRSLLLPALLKKKYTIPNDIYVPALRQGEVTKHVRMLQTITPFAAKYNLSINSAYEETDYQNIAKSLLNEKGTILIVWEHKNIAPIIRYLGVKGISLSWADDDFDSIWIVTFSDGAAHFTADRENLNPSSGCPF